MMVVQFIATFLTIKYVLIFDCHIIQVRTVLRSAISLR